MVFIQILKKTLIENLQSILILKVENSVFRKKNSKIAKQNNVHEDKTLCCIYISKQTFENHVGFILLSSFKNCHYVLIKDFNRFITNKTKDRSKKHFCRYCLKCFSN